MLSSGQPQVMLPKLLCLSLLHSFFSSYITDLSSISSTHQVKLSVAKFIPTKSQKKIIRKVEKFINDETSSIVSCQRKNQTRSPVPSSLEETLSISSTTAKVDPSRPFDATELCDPVLDQSLCSAQRIKVQSADREPRCNFNQQEISHCNSAIKSAFLGVLGSLYPTLDLSKIELEPEVFELSIKAKKKHSSHFSSTICLRAGSVLRSHLDSELDSTAVACKVAEKLQSQFPNVCAVGGFLNFRCSEEQINELLNQRGENHQELSLNLKTNRRRHFLLGTAAVDELSSFSPAIADSSKKQSSSNLNSRGYGDDSTVAPKKTFEVRVE